MDYKTSSLSIIIPTYNSSETLGKAIESVINQTFTNYEILIIDNCSSDCTLTVAKEYTSKYPGIQVFSEPDRGIYDAMNKGIKMAKGEWICFLGSDDKFSDNNVLSDVLGSSLMKSEKVIYGNVLVKGNAGWAVNGQIYDGKFTLAKLMEKNICHQAMFFKRDLFIKHVGFDTRFTICADWDMNIRLWSKCTFKYIDRTIAVFNGGSRSSINIDNNYTDTDRWESVIKSFRFKLFSKGFYQYTSKFLTMSLYYKKNHLFLKALFLKLVYLKHTLANIL